MEKSENKYSIILPTYNEKDNLPLIIRLIFKMADEKQDNKINFFNIKLIHFI